MFPHEKWAGNDTTAANQTSNHFSWIVRRCLMQQWYQFFVQITLSFKKGNRKQGYVRWEKYIQLVECTEILTAFLYA